MVMEIRLADARLAVDPVHDGQTLAADGLDCGEPVIGLKVPTRIVVDAFGRHIGATLPTAEANRRLVRRSPPSAHRMGASPSGSQFRLFLGFDGGTTAWCRAAMWPALSASL